MNKKIYHVRVVPYAVVDFIRALDNDENITEYVVTKMDNELVIGFVYEDVRLRPVVDDTATVNPVENSDE